MEAKSRRIVLPCDCKCCMFVIEKTLWEDGTVNYDISVQDARYDHGCNTVWGRLKRAGKALFGRPVYYNDLYLEGEGSFKKFVEEMQRLSAADLREENAS